MPPRQKLGGLSLWQVHYVDGPARKSVWALQSVCLDSCRIFVRSIVSCGPRQVRQCRLFDEYQEF